MQLCWHSVLKDFHYQNNLPIRTHLRLEQHGRNFAENKYSGLNDTYAILSQISPKFVPRGPSDNTSPLAQVMMWLWICDKRLPEPTLLIWLQSVVVTQGVSIEDDKLLVFYECITCKVTLDFAWKRHPMLKFSWTLHKGFLPKAPILTFSASVSKYTDVPSNQQFVFTCNGKLHEVYLQRQISSCTHSLSINWLIWPNNAYMRQQGRPSLVQIMACRLFSRQAITWTNACLLVIGSLGTNFSGIWVKIQQLSI